MRVARAVAIGVVVGGLMTLVWRGSMGGHADRPLPVAEKSAEQRLTEEIFRTNASAPTDPELATEYAAINARYFDDRLPQVRLRWEPRLAEIGPLIAEGFRMGGVTDGRLILLNPAIAENPDEFRRVLCHEVVHIAVVTEREAHGPIFQAYLKQLLEKGAFNGIVATEAEKEERRRALDRQSAALTAETALLAETKAQLDADAGTGRVAIDDLNARSNAYNDRVRRHNDAVVEFNRSVEEYNRMVSYPDGLDRERVSRRVSVPLQAR